MPPPETRQHQQEPPPVLPIRAVSPEGFRLAALAAGWLSDVVDVYLRPAESSRGVLVPRGPVKVAGELLTIVW